MGDLFQIVLAGVDAAPGCSTSRALPARRRARSGGTPSSDRAPLGLATELPAETAAQPAPARAADEQLWRRLVDLIEDQLQVDREEIVPGARFRDDLGAD